MRGERDGLPGERDGRAAGAGGLPGRAAGADSLHKHPTGPASLPGSPARAARRAGLPGRAAGGSRPGASGRPDGPGTPAAPGRPGAPGKPGVLVCPVCGRPLREDAQGADCEAGHHYDRAHEGYLNLLRTSKPGKSTGDPKEAARSRRAFLDKGYYQPLRDKLVEMVGELAAGVSPEALAAGGALGRPAAPARLRLLDICCGEGYYTSALGALPGVEAWGFDLSKEMVRLAAKRGGAECFVANLKSIPVADGSFDAATHLFAPFDAAEFARALRPGGTLLSVVPGARHLLGLKEALYDTPYLNDERLPLDGGDRSRSAGADFESRARHSLTGAPDPGAPRDGQPKAGAPRDAAGAAGQAGSADKAVASTPDADVTEPGAPEPARPRLRLVGRARVAAEIRLASPDDIEAVFRMTPYYYRTKPADRARLAGLSQLDTPIEFVIGVYLRE